MAKDVFVNLHLHTESSLQDSVITIPKLYRQVKQYEQSAVAITDHGSCANWVEFSNYFGKKGNIKPIFGNEFYCTNQGIFAEDKKRRDHLVLLAMNAEGLVNIRRLQRFAVYDYYYKPLLYYDKVLNKNDTNGIYALSACSLSSISKSILDGDMQKATSYCEYFNDLFNGNFSLELQFHPDYKEQRLINEKIVDLSDRLDIPLVVTCDAHFCNIDEDRELRKIMQAACWGKMFDDETLYDTLKSNCIGNSELIKQFAQESGFEYPHIVNQAIQQTSKVASLCNAQLEQPQRRIPLFDKHYEFDDLFEEVIW